LRGRVFGGAPELVEPLFILELGAEARALLDPKAGAADGAERKNDAECQ
jgi:hypothetical protein